MIEASPLPLSDGDSERKIVVGISLGRTATLRFYWRAPGSSLLHKGPFDFTVEHGDIYIMSEKASGFDWKSQSKYQLVHAAGAPSYLKYEAQPARIAKPAKAVKEQKKQ